MGNDANRGATNRTAACAGALLAALTGCAVGPDFVRPAAPAVESYTAGTLPPTVSGDRQEQRFEPGTKIAGDWWLLFLSAKLDRLVKEALAGNPGLQSAQASLRQSQYNLRAGYGVFFPWLDAGFDASRQKFSPARFGTAGSASIFSLFTLSATVNYPLDIFGGERRAVEGLAAREDLQHALLLGTYLTLTGNLVNTVIARGAYREEIGATERLIGMQKEQLRIGAAQLQAGTVPYANLVSLQSQLASLEATLPPLRQRLDQAEHLLATLAGQAPALWSQPGIELAELTLPYDLPVTLPSDLVRQRPDILAAEAQLHSACANVGVSTAALFPSFALNGSYGQNNNSLGELMKSSGNFWSLGANLTAPLFHGGALWFNRKAAQEAYRQAQADYRQTLLGAFAQVADTLRALEHDAETLEAQAQALAAAQQALSLVTANYRAGTVGYLPVLVADAAFQQASIGYIQAKAQRYQDTVALYVALGGGWWNAGKDIAGRP